MSQSLPGRHRPGDLFTSFREYIRNCVCLQWLAERDGTNDLFREAASMEFPALHASQVRMSYKDNF